MRLYLYPGSLPVLVLGALLIGLQPASGQSFALARQQPQSTPAAPGVATRRLADVLNDLKARYQTDILFEDRTLANLNVPANALGSTISLEQALGRLLKPFNLRYKQVKPGTWVVLTRRPLVPPATGQDQSAQVTDPTLFRQEPAPVDHVSSAVGTARPEEVIITGTVKATDNGEVLPGVSVILKGTSRGTTTDANGRYQLSVPEPTTGPASLTLVFSFVGYVSQEIAPGNRQSVDVQLAPDDQTLSEVVVVGYGTQKKSDLTGSVASVKAKDLNALPQTTVTQALQGRAAGVQVTQNSGQPGGTVTVRIRGSNSIVGGNNPLYVVDGFALSGTPSALNPADIESIDVLKDASATAIYGSRGANGVIIVTTRRGKSGKGQIDIDSYYAVQQPIKEIPLLSGREFAELANERALNDKLAPYFTADQINSFGEGTNWQRELFRTAPMQNHVLTFSGGNDKLQYSASANYLNQQGIVQTSDYWKAGARANINHKVNNRLNLAYSMIVSRTNRNQISGENSSRGDGVTSALLVAPPTVSPLDANGNYSNVVPYTFSPNVLRNPLALAREVKNQNQRDYTLANIALTYQLVEGLSVRTSIGIESDKAKGNFYSSRRLADITPTGSASQSYADQLNVLNENTLTYTRTLAERHNLTALGGFTYQTQTNQNFSASATGFANDNLQFYTLQAGSTPGIPTSSYSDWSLLSYLGRVNYSFANKYLLTASIRTDGSSRFGTNNKWGYFPSAAIGWRLIEEPFLKDARWLSDLKLRGSWGKTGNTGLNPYQTLNQLNPYQTIFGNELTIGYAPGTSLSNPDLKWESTTQTNIGLDAGFLQNRLQLNLDFYIKNTTDLLATVPLPPGSGYNQTTQNIGSIRNAGIELSVSANVLRGPVRWDVSANGSANRNEVRQLSGGSDVFGTALSNPLGVPVNLVRVGQPVGVFYGFKENGLDEQGAIRFVDLNGDGLINDNDRTIIGNPNPKFTYGFNSTTSWKNFDFTFFLQGVQGIDVFNFNTASYANSFNFGENQLKDLYDNHWRADRPDPNAKYPKISVNTRFRASDRYVEDASYLRLKNVQLAYNLPAARLGLTWLRSAQIYLSAQNLLTLTRYTWYDPEVSTQGGTQSGDVSLGIDQNSYPNTKLTTLGVRIGL
ncbi:SusC/RagA family TonB-linked outer membrane protein [Spirosoma utsteinense]|uniref:TonB-linked SusC/RagA family outer membrane protein n=1 Tax=Spirosoma utsteinense TaxID=2585773 RepID=A0ABR6WAE9_9BACT|nr:SusC/RagA family TonB-linked outer membrane protein [Spirosoma utsteinense]MBC3783875.1 TonB-linked SusC/RagA family outer membrane protein [Spirosoma utsteinense]MBC3793546.1 TonB-linked SusC/RagA family outer membrane protein [Spirosoma utsteinense]